jgi:hypothetical protein
MSPTLPPELVADLARLSKCARCSRSREPDSDHCAECDARQRGYVAKSKAKVRGERRASHECIDCAVKLPPKWTGARCKRCRHEQAKRAARRRRVKRAARSVKRDRPIPPPARGHFKTEVFADGAERTRYVGQSHRGGPTRIEQDASAAKLVAVAVGGGKEWLDERLERQALVDALPRIQRAAGRREIGARLTYLGRLLIQAGAEYGDDTAKELLRALYPDDADG